MIRVFYNRITGRLEIRNLIGPERRLPEIIEFLKKHRNLIQIEEYVTRIPARLLYA